MARFGMPNGFTHDCFEAEDVVERINATARDAERATVEAIAAWLEREAEARERGVCAHVDDVPRVLRKLAIRAREGAWKETGR